MLAYFYLHPHDDRLVKFTVDHDGELFRFADDITILVDSEAKGRRALKAVTDSLRELGLVASIEKTEIMRSSDGTKEVIAEFGDDLGWAPKADSQHRLRLQAEIHPQDRWVDVVRFDWWAPPKDAMGIYVVHRNTPLVSESVS